MSSCASLPAPRALFPSYEHTSGRTHHVFFHPDASNAYQFVDFVGQNKRAGWYINMGVEAIIETDFVQDALPDLDSVGYEAMLFTLHRFRGIEYPTTDEHVKKHIMYTGLGLIKHERNASVWKEKYRKESLDGEQPIKFLLKRILDTEGSDPAGSPPSNSTYLKDSAYSLIALLDSSNIPETPLLENEDYEFLYYAIVCKIKQLYRSLQLCYASNFFPQGLDTELYLSKPKCFSSITQAPTLVTVGAVRNFLITTWHVCQDESLRGRLDQAVRIRKVRSLTLTPTNPDGQPNPYYQLSPNSSQRSSEDVGTSATHRTLDEIQDSGLWNTIQGLQRVKNPAAIQDSVYSKYSLGHHGPHGNASPPRAKANPVKIFNDDGLSNRNMPNTPTRKSSSRTKTSSTKSRRMRRPTPPAIPDFTPTPAAPATMCSCPFGCTCKFICIQAPDVCPCRNRRVSLGHAQHRVRDRFVPIPAPLQILRKATRVRADSNASRGGGFRMGAEYTGTHPLPAPLAIVHGLGLGIETNVPPDLSKLVPTPDSDVFPQTPTNFDTQPESLPMTPWPFSNICQKHNITPQTAPPSPPGPPVPPKDYHLPVSRIAHGDEHKENHLLTWPRKWVPAGGLLPLEFRKPCGQPFLLSPTTTEGVTPSKPEEGDVAAGKKLRRVKERIGGLKIFK